MYRVTKRARERRQDWPKLGRDPDVPGRTEAWRPKGCRKIVVVIDLDSGRPMMTMMQLWTGRRIDLYRVRTPRGEARKQIGWSLALAGLRKAIPRVRV